MATLCAGGCSDWILGNIFSPKEWQCIGTGTPGGDELTAPGEVQELWRYGTYRHGLVGDIGGR